MPGSRTLHLALIALLTAFAIWGFTQERAMRTFASPRAEAAKQVSQGVARDFGDDGSSLVLLVDHLGQRGDLFEPQAARALRKILAAVRALPEVGRAFAFDQVPVRQFGLFESELLPDPDAGASRLASARKRALENPIVAGNLLSDDARTAAVSIQLLPRDGLDIQGLLANLDAAAKAAAESSPLRTRLVGGIPVQIARQDALMGENLRFQIIGYTLAVTLALLLFRGIGPTLVVVLPAAVGVFWTLGLLGFTGVELGGLSQVVMPVLLTMIAFTNAAHIALGVRREIEAGLSRRDAIETALRKLRKPCALSALTTAVGFGSLIVAEASMIKDFGRDCALGTALTFTAVIVLVPMLAASPLGAGLASKRATHPSHHSRDRFRDMFSDFVAVVIARAPAVVGVSVLLSACFAWLALGLTPDIRVRPMLPDGSDVQTGLEHADGALGGLQVVRVAIDWDGTAGADPFDVIGAVETVLANEPLLTKALSVNTILQAAPAAARIWTTREQILREVPPDMLAPFYRPDIGRAVINTRAQDLGVATYAKVYDRIERELAGLEGRYPGFQLRLTGSGPDWHRYLHRMVTDLALSLSVAAVVILLVITAAYRSLRVGLIAVLPNLFPLLVCAGGLAALGKPLSLEIVCAFTICLGIAADDSIHFLSRFRAERAEGASLDNALGTSFIRVGHVLLVTTLVMVAGIGSILLSSLPMYRSFATIACATLAAALVADLIILPALLKLFARGGGRQPAG